MQSIALLAHRFGRLAGLGAVGLLAAAGAINTAVAESPLVTGPSPFAAPAPVVQTLDAPVPVVVPQYAFESPMPGFRINSRFGFRKLPGERGRMHEGVDYAAPTGAAIKAASSGTVLRAGLSPTYGNFVEVDHGDGVTTFYAHMSRRAAAAGEPVKAGDVLGYVGSTGHVTGPHLHFEVRKNERQFDPMRVLGQTFASLKDLPAAGQARLTRASQTPTAPVPYRVLSSGRVSATLQ
ncbi:MAG: M23 family metallopeptidase [Caulobacteraceae bacterium]|nr:M23 family metallopeptidase [Caulobacteraceae bacterium]